MPGLCLPYYRPPNSIRRGLLSLVTLLYPTSACLLFLHLLVFCSFVSCLDTSPRRLNHAGPSSSLSQVLSFLSQEGLGGCPSSGLEACWALPVANPYFTSQVTLCLSTSFTSLLPFSASILFPGYYTGFAGLPILPGPPSPAALPCTGEIWYTLPG